MPSSNKAAQCAVSESEHMNQVEAGDFVRKINDHFKDSPGDINTFRTILGNHNTGKVNALQLYIFMYAFLYNRDSLHFLEPFQRFMPDEWNYSDLERLHPEIEAATGEEIRFMQLCARARSESATTSSTSSSEAPPNSAQEIKAHNTQNHTTTTEAEDLRRNPTTPTGFGAYTLNRPTRPSPLRTSTVLQNTPSNVQATPDNPSDPRLLPTWNVPISISKQMNYDLFPEPSPISSPLLTEEEKHQREILTGYVQKALDAQSAVFLSDEMRAKGLEELRALVKAALRRKLGF